MDATQVFAGDALRRINASARVKFRLRRNLWEMQKECASRAGTALRRRCELGSAGAELSSMGSDTKRKSKIRMAPPKYSPLANIFSLAAGQRATAVCGGDVNWAPCIPHGTQFKRKSGTSIRTKKSIPKGMLVRMEAPPRFELGREGFADLCLTTWLWRHE